MKGTKKRRKKEEKRARERTNAMGGHLSMANIKPVNPNISFLDPDTFISIC